MIGTTASAPPMANAALAGAARGGPRPDAAQSDAEATPVAADVAGDCTPARGGRARDAASASEPAFSDLLAPPPLPPAPPAPPPPAPPGEAADAATGTDAPAHLLALLDGAWAGVRVAAAGTSDAAPQPTAGASAAAATLLPAAQAAQAASGDARETAQALAGRLASAAAETATPGVAAAPAEAGAREGAGTSAGFSIEIAAVPVSTPAPLAAVRAPLATVALPPLPMPADPAAGFDDGLGTRVVWMAEQRLGHAEIRLNPERVGPIEVRVELDGEQVRAEFHSAHAEVRQAIEASLPRLRELLGQHGLQLGQADVGQGQAGRDGGEGRTAASGSGGDGAGTREETPQRTGPVRLRGLVDEYA